MGLAPHLDEFDLADFAGYDVFVCNDFFGLYPEPPFDPKWYVCSDRRAWRRQWQNVVDRDTSMLLGDVLFDAECPLHNWTPGRRPGPDGDPMGFGPGPEPVREWYGFRTIHRTDDVQFGDDPEHGFHNGGTVIYDALQWAVFMGYNPIGIVGVDLAWPDNPKAPTHARKFKGRKHDKFPPNTRYALQYFRYAAALLRHLNVEAFNLAPEGRGQLDVFPRLSLAAFADQ